MRLPLVLSALLGIAAPLAAFAQDDAPPARIVPVVLKLDDVRTNASGWLSERWRRLGDLARDRNIKLSLGVIADSLENPKEGYVSWLREMQETGRAELWFHGYDHAVWTDEAGVKRCEFYGRPYEDQLDRFVRSQKLAQEKLGFSFATFGPGGGGQGASQDAATLRAMAEAPGMAVWLYPSPIDDAGRQLAAAGKITILDRVWQVNIEQPLFLPNYEKFVAGYNQHAAKRDYFVLQGHPAKWDDARWAEFVRIIDYITRHNIPTLTPTQLALTLNPDAL
jgi:hypothetical protein